MPLSLIQIKLWSAILLGAIALMAGYYPFHHRFKKQRPLELPLAEGFAYGVFLGAALIHMLPDANLQLLQLGYHFPFAFLLAGVVFLILFGIEQSGKLLHPSTHHNVFCLMAVLMLSIHSLLEGAALGLSSNLVIALIIFLAIIAHKWAAGFALAVQINKSSFTLFSRVLLFISFAAMTPLGIFAGAWITLGNTTHPIIEPFCTALAAGTFLYLGTLHGVGKEVFQHQWKLFSYLGLVSAGFGTMALVALWA